MTDLELRARNWLERYAVPFTNAPGSYLIECNPIEELLRMVDSLECELRRLRLDPLIKAQRNEARAEARRLREENKILWATLDALGAAEAAQLRETVRSDDAG